MAAGNLMRTQAADFVLVWLSAWAMSVVGFNAFFLESAAAWSTPVAAAACAALTALLMWASRTRRQLPFRIVCYLLAIAALIGVCIALSTTDAPYEDAEGNYFYLAICIVVVSTAAFLLTRRLATSAVWFIACSFSCSLIEAFYQRGAVLPSIAACLLALALIVYRNFHMGLMQADAARQTSAAANLASSVLPVAAAVGLAAVAWFALIAPLNPGVMKVTLITDYRQLPIIELKGVANVQPTLNYELTSNKTVAGDRYTTDDLLKGASDIIIDAKSVLDSIASGGSAESGQGTDSGVKSGLDKESTEEQMNAQSYTLDLPLALFVLLLVLAIAALIGAAFYYKHWRRRHRLKRMLALEPLQQMQSMYLFLLSRLKRLGFAVPQGMTLEEFAQTSSRRMAVIDDATRVPFALLTQIFVARSCDRSAPTEEELVAFVAYYDGFWKAARRYLGRVKYFFKSFWL